MPKPAPADPIVSDPCLPALLQLSSASPSFSSHVPVNHSFDPIPSSHLPYHHPQKHSLIRGALPDLPDGDPSILPRQHPWSHHPPQSLNRPRSNPSCDTFFPSHRAHRSFRGSVERFHRSSPAINSERHLDPSSWSPWSSSNRLTDNDPKFHPGTRHPTIKDQYLADPNQPFVPNVPQDSRLHCDSDSVFPSAIRAVDSCGPNDKAPFHIGFPGSQNQFPLPLTPSVASTPASLASTRPSSVNTRSREGLPSNSHHLLNSPETTSVQVIKNPGTTLAPLGQSPHHEISPEFHPSCYLDVHDGTPQKSSYIPQPLFESPSSSTRHHTAFRRSQLTPKNAKAAAYSQASEKPNPQADAPSDDAASILLALSRSEPQKHSMALRRGRGGASRADAPANNVAMAPRISFPPTPSIKRYRTRSQIHDEAPSADESAAPELSPGGPLPTKDGPTVATERLRSNKNGMQQIRDLGLGRPPLGRPDDEMISVSNAYDANGASRPMTADSSFQTPSHEPFSLHHLLCRTQLNTRGKLQHPRLSGGSKTPSTATAGTGASTAPGTVMATDEDARSSFSISTQATSMILPSGYPTRRTFPPEVPIDPSFPRLYRAFFVSCAFGEPEPVKSLAEKHGISVVKEPSGSVYNPPAHGFLDLYTPRYVKGVGSEKVGLCCICAENKDRGGEDQELWLKMKVSSYSYHLSFFHGINNADGLPFSPPVEIRHAKRGRVAANEKTELKEGRCHECNKWIPMEGVKMQEVKVPELFWWKHAKSCHRSRIPGECHVHVPDEVFDLVGRQHSLNNSNQSAGGVLALSSCSTPFQYSHMNHDSPLSQPAYTGRYNAASPAPTCASSVSLPGTTRVHPSVAAQRASAGRVYKRKASNSSLQARKEISDRPSSARYSHGSSFSTGFAASSSLGMNMVYHQPPPSPTPQQTSSSTSVASRKSRRCNSWGLV